MKIHKHFTALLISSLVINTILSAQGIREPQQMMGPPSGSYKWISGVISVSLPFEMIGNLVVIPIEINNIKTRFILDTGMPLMGGLITNSKKAETLKLYYSGEAQIGGAGGGMAKAKIASGVNFKIGNLEFKNQTFIVMPESKNLTFFETDGVIGNEILSRFIVDINYDSKTITLTEPSNYIPTKNAEEIKINIESGIPFVNSSAIMESGKIVPLNMVLDLGASHSLSFVLGSQKSIVLPAKNIKVSTGRGINTELFGYMGRIKKFKIGSYSFDNPLVSFSENKLMPFEKEGNLGSGILKRFNVTFDYPNKRFFIKPNKSFNDPFEFNMAGIQTSKLAGGIIKIDRVLPNSAGMEAGLMVEDVIVKVNNTKAIDIPNAEFQKIFEKDNEVVVIEIKRGDEIKTISVKTRRII